MSADNWTECPRCLVKATKIHVADQDKADKAYGNVPVDEYLALRAIAEKPVEIDQTLREDYEFYLDSKGKFLAVYCCECTTGGCGYSFNFRHEEMTDV